MPVLQGHSRRWLSSARNSETQRDVIIVGAGLSGLTAAWYLAKAGLRVSVVESRHLPGGTSITEEIVPGYKFNRGFDVVGFLRPRIVSDLGLKERGLQILKRNPFHLTPMRDSSRFLMLGPDQEFNTEQIMKFSAHDAKAYSPFTDRMKRLAWAIAPILDEAPIDFLSSDFHSALAIRDKLESLGSSARFAARLMRLGFESVDLVEMYTAPLSRIIRREFESEPLCMAIARPSLNGSFTGPSQPGTAALLMRHMLGGADGENGEWSFVSGGMSSLSNAIAEAAIEVGTELKFASRVSQIDVDDNGARGVTLDNGGKIRARTVVSSLDPHTTFTQLLPSHAVPDEFLRNVKSLNYESGVFKLNIALHAHPTLAVIPRKDSDSRPEHGCTIYMGAESLEDLDTAYFDASVNRRPSQKLLISITFPSALDPSLAPEGHAVASITVQHVPYGLPWNNSEYKDQFVKKIFSSIDDYIPGFSKLVVGFDALSPHDLEQLFGIHRGNLFHCAMSVDQMYFLRPLKHYSRYRSPLNGLYICGSGTHPGGGVSGASGRNCAQVILKDKRGRVEGELLSRGLTRQKDQ